MTYSQPELDQLQDQAVADYVDCMADLAYEMANALREQYEPDYYEERPEFQVGYRRPELVNQTAEIHDDLSDEIKLRLVLARKRALERYYEKWG